MNNPDYKYRYKDKSLSDLLSIQSAHKGDKDVPDECVLAVKELIVECKHRFENPLSVPQFHGCDSDLDKSIKTHPDHELAKQYLNKVRSCQKRGIDFQLSLNEYRSIKNKNSCFYTGIKFDDTYENKLTIDRIDSKLGYTKDNSVACCNQVNALKNSLFESETRTTTITAKQLKRLADQLIINEVG